MARFEANPDGIKAAMQSTKVRAGLKARGAPIAARAQQIAAAEKVKGEVSTSEGTRPKGRPYARVTADAGQEFGDTNTARRRILGRAAGG